MHYLASPSKSHMQTHSPTERVRSRTQCTQRWRRAKYSVILSKNANHSYLYASFIFSSLIFFFFSFVYFSEEQFECHKLSSALPSTHHTVIPQFIALLSFIFFLLACRMHADTEYASFNVHLLLGRWGLIHQTPRRSGMQYFFFQKCCSVLSAVCLK